MRFETDRLIVRKPIREDALDCFRNYTQDPDVVKYLTWTPHEKLEDTRGWIDFCIEHFNSDEMLVFTIFHIGDNQAIGMLDFRMEGFKSHFGYVLAKRYWDRGIMTEAMKPVFEYVWKMDSIYKIWACHDVENPASGKVMKKLGMTKDGICRNWMMHPNISAKPRDCVIYSRNKD